MTNTVHFSRTWLCGILTVLLIAAMAAGNITAQVTSEFARFIPGSIEMISNGNGPIIGFTGFESTLPPTSTTGALSADWWRDVIAGPASVVFGPPMQAGGGYFFLVAGDFAMIPGHERLVTRWLRGDNYDRVVGNSYEIRFTAEGGLSLSFTTASPVEVPFELWFLGSTPNDPTDDVRMIPLLFDVGGDDAFSWQLDHAASSREDDPFSDWIYFRFPLDDTPGQAGYDAWVANPSSGIGPEHLARVSLMNWNMQQAGPDPVQAGPETETTFRLSFKSLIEVAVDIKPEDDTNEIACGDKSQVTVAVLSTEDFDATSIDGETVTFNGAAEVHKQAHVEDVDADGDADVVLHFVTAVACGTTKLELAGRTVGGDVVFGGDAIQTVAPPVGACDLDQAQELARTRDGGLHDKGNRVSLGLSKNGGAGSFGFFGESFGDLDCNPYLFFGGPWIAGFRPGGQPHASVTDFGSLSRFGADFVPGDIGSTAMPYRVFDSDVKEDKRVWPPEFSSAKGEAEIVKGAENLVVEYDDDNSERSSDRLPMGVEIRQRSLAFGGEEAATAIVFIWNITNLSGEDFSDTYFGYWLDFDIGDAGDDFTSTAMDMAVGWDSDFSEAFTEVPFVMGFAYLETPEGEVIYSSHSNNAGPCGYPSDSEDYYNYLAGLNREGEPISDCYRQVAATPGDQRMVLSTPMNLAAGETARIAGALLFGSVPDGTTSLSVDPISFLVDPADPALADLFAKRENVQLLYDALLAEGKLGKAGQVAADAESVPGEYALHGNYPNPFNPSTSIRFDLPVASEVRLVMFDLLGREVATILNEPMEAGQHSVTWEAGKLPSGVYLYRLEAGDFNQTRRMVLLK